MTTMISSTLQAIRGLEKVKARLEKTHKLQILAVDEEIENLQKSCPHTNAYDAGWEGGRYTSCPDCGKDW